jgi:hypothetical protein
MSRAARPSLRPRLPAALRRLWRREDGGGAIELVLVLPLMMTVFLAAYESGFLMVRQIMLERAVDQVVREIRLGQVEDPTPEGMKADICDRTVILDNCAASISINLQTVSKDTWNLPAGEIPCVDRVEEIDPTLIANPNQPSEVMLVRVCVIQEALFPGAGLGLGLVREGDTGYALISVAAFNNEP